MPEFLLGFLLSPLLRRGTWFIEFLYPMRLAGWGHFFLLRLGGKGRDAVHSKCTEQRTEVVQGRVYVHPIPQLLDNVGYLIVCCPPSPPGKISSEPILALVVDCGDSQAVISFVSCIRDIHYPNHRLEVHGLLCTHKHHDHTAGNKSLLRSKECKSTLKHVFGGAVERVPMVTNRVVNGEILNLPCVGDNDMNEVVEIEVLAVPSHTRGSVVYALRNKSGKETISHLFTGDAMFSGGGGVPFESDIEFPSDRNLNKKGPGSLVKVAAGINTIERCFAEVLTRGLGRTKHDNNERSALEKMLIYPGHEYTADLLLRQFDASNDYAGQWNKAVPSVFFETASQYFVSNHRRTLPKGNRLLTVPSPIGRELNINPHFRSLSRRGEHVVNAIKFWHRHFATNRVKPRDDADDALEFMIRSSTLPNSQRNETKSPVFNNESGSDGGDVSTWTTTAHDINKKVFTTVYTSNLDEIISSLKSGSISSVEASDRLTQLKTQLDTPVVSRRPIPNTLPTDRAMYLGVMGLALLASPPCGMTVSDSRDMNLPRPVDGSDHILVSCGRLIDILGKLGLLENKRKDKVDLKEVIRLLWREAQSSDGNKHELSLGSNYDATADAETASKKNDWVELGYLKWALYGAAMNQPSWFTKLCHPCGGGSKNGSGNGTRRPRGTQKAPKAKMRVSNGELVGHDIKNCPMCKGLLGNLESEAEEEKAEESERNTNVDSGAKSPKLIGSQVSDLSEDERCPHVNAKPGTVVMMTSSVSNTTSVDGSATIEEESGEVEMQVVAPHRSTSAEW